MPLQNSKCINAEVALKVYLKISVEIGSIPAGVMDAAGIEGRVCFLLLRAFIDIR